MKVVTIFTAFSVLIASSEAILNGEVSAHRPYYARITYRPVEGDQNVILNKAGTILSDRFVLTTGSFFFSASDIRVWVGSYERTRQQFHSGIGSLRLSDHPDGPALVQLAVPLNFTSVVRSIRIIPQNRLMGLMNEEGMIVGMGGLIPGVSRDRLNAAYMRIVSPQICGSNYPDRANNAYFCAYDSRERSDFCPEDRGSAFTVNHRGEEFLVGIAVESVCSIIGHTRPSLFASIGHFRTRINEILDGRQGV